MVMKRVPFGEPDFQTAKSAALWLTGLRWRRFPEPCCLSGYCQDLRRLPFLTVYSQTHPATASLLQSDPLPQIASHPLRFLFLTGRLTAHGVEHNQADGGTRG